MMRGNFSLRLAFVLIVAVLSALCGAIFNHGLDAILQFHRVNPWCVWLLPALLMLTRFLEKSIAHITLESPQASEDSKDNLQIKRERQFGVLLVPLTWIAHLGGASVGRESVAARLGQSIASELRHQHKVFFAVLEESLAARIGVACGFAAVFGTPFAAAIFAVESLAGRRIATATPSALNLKGRTQLRFAGGELRPLMLCILGAWIAHLCATYLFKVTHPKFAIASNEFNLTFLWFLSMLVVAAGMGCFIHKKLSNLFQTLFAASPLNRWWVIFIATLAMSALLSQHNFSPFKNLGTDFIQSALLSHGIENTIKPWDWALKSMFTAIFLALGFRGGEVTPLLSIGVLLAVPAGALLGITPPLAAASGYSMMFALVFNVPLTGAILALETFGFKNGSGAVIACLLSGLIFSKRSTHLSE